MAANTPEPKWTIYARSLPYWFAAVAGLIYGTGFLIEFTFMNSLGIRNAGTDVFKAKYIYIGILSLQFPASIAVTILGYIRLLRIRMADKQTLASIARGHNTGEVKVARIRRIGWFFKELVTDVREWAYVAGILTILILICFLYFIIAFSDPGFFAKNQPVIFGIIVGIPLVIVTLREWEDSRRPEAGPTWGSAATRWVFLGVFTYFTASLLRDDFGLLKEITVQGGWLHVTLIVVIGVLIYWLEKNPSRTNTEMTISLCLIATFGYLSVITFAYRVYPYIPVERGGGDFSRQVRLSTLFFDRTSDKALPQLATLLTSGAAEISSIRDEVTVVVLDETASTLYVTVPKCIAQPHASPQNMYLATALSDEFKRWRQIGPDKKPGTISAIKREALIGVTTRIVDKNEQLSAVVH